MPIVDGSKTVAAAGTRERLAASRTVADWVIVQALVANTNPVFVGGSTVAPTSGIRLASGDAYQFPPIGQGPAYNLADIWVDVTTNGEGVQFLYGVK